MNEYFPKPNSLGANLKVELNLPNYATKTNLKNRRGFDTSFFVKKTDLANLKSDVDKLDTDKVKNVPSGLSSLKSKLDKLDVDKLVSVPIDLSKLSNVTKNYVVKKDVCNGKIKNIENKILDITNLTTKTMLNAKLKEAKRKIPSIIDSATTTALTAVERKMPNVSNLVERTNYNTKN